MARLMTHHINSAYYNIVDQYLTLFNMNVVFTKDVSFSAEPCDMERDRGVCHGEEGGPELRYCGT